MIVPTLSGVALTFRRPPIEISHEESSRLVEKLPTVFDTATTKAASLVGFAAGLLRKTSLMFTKCDGQSEDNSMVILSG